MSSGLTLLHASYEPTQEFFADYNRHFQREGGPAGGVEVQQSHRGSRRQAATVAGGTAADVVSLASAEDIDHLVRKGLVKHGWRRRFPYTSSPFYSTIVFVVRKGNPKRIVDWGDLANRDLRITMADPRASGSACAAYLGLWAHGLSLGGGENGARDFVCGVLERVPVFDLGTRLALLTFTHRQLGDVFLTFEHDARALVTSHNQFEIVVPPRSVLVEPSVAIVDRYADERETRRAASAYLSGLFENASQMLAALHHFRPREAKAAAESRNRFPAVRLFSPEEIIGNYAEGWNTHFRSGGVFDTLLRAAERVRGAS